ncbi:MAG: hypothetical protein ACO3A0_06350, partial [Ilumatobacteraceae bacterium]
EPEHDVTAIGSGGNFALAAARGLMHSDLPAEEIARKAMAIAPRIASSADSPGCNTIESRKPSASFSA